MQALGALLSVGPGEGGEGGGVVVVVWEDERDERRKGTSVRLSWLCLLAPACSGPHKINNLLCWLSLSRLSPRISTTKKVSGNQLSDRPGPEHEIN